MSEKSLLNWIKLADYDLQTAKEMQISNRFIYVAFLCQQCIEKMLKALFVKEKNHTPPYIHNLNRILENISIKNNFSEEQLELLNELNSYYIETRYTEEIEDLLISLNEEMMINLLKKTEELFLWLKAQIQ